MLNGHYLSEVQRVLGKEADRLAGSGDRHAAILVRRALIERLGGPESRGGKEERGRIERLVEQLSRPTAADKKRFKDARARKLSDKKILEEARALLAARKYGAVVALCKDLTVHGDGREVKDAARALSKTAVQRAASDFPPKSIEAAKRSIHDVRFDRLAVVTSRHFLYMGPRKFVDALTERDRMMMDLAYIFQSDLTNQHITYNGVRVVIYYQEDVRLRRRSRRRQDDPHRQPGDPRAHRRSLALPRTRALHLRTRLAAPRIHRGTRRLRRGFHARLAQANESRAELHHDLSRTVRSLLSRPQATLLSRPAVPPLRGISVFVFAARGSAVRLGAVPSRVSSHARGATRRLARTRAPAHAVLRILAGDRIRNGRARSVATLGLARRPRRLFARSGRGRVVSLRRARRRGDAAERLVRGCGVASRRCAGASSRRLDRGARSVRRPAARR